MTYNFYNIKRELPLVVLWAKVIMAQWSLSKLNTKMYKNDLNLKPYMDCEKKAIYKGVSWGFFLKWPFFCYRLGTASLVPLRKSKLT